jgi:hypothetical protein
MVKLLFTIKSVYCFQALPFLGKWGFSISDYGEIIDANGTIVLKAATIEAVTKALHNL